jgi:hypothetical protein
MNEYIFTDVEFEVLTPVVMKSTIFWDITPRSPLRVNRRFGGTYCLHLQGRRNKLSKKSACLLPAFTLVSCSAYFFILKMEAICSSETSVDTQRTTLRYIPKDGTLQSLLRCDVMHILHAPTPPQRKPWLLLHGTPCMK